MIIYKATNKINGKCYIGQTINSLESRKTQHISSKSKAGFCGALKKYGPDLFEWKVIDECDCIETLNMLEKRYIEKYNSHIDNKGYNLTYGGYGILHYKHTDETKKLISETSKKCWKDPEYRKKVNTPERNKKIGKKISIISQARWSDPATRKKWINTLTISAQRISRRKRQSEIMKERYSDVEEREKQGERSSKNWRITDPNGNVILIKNLSKFCRVNDINNKSLWRISKTKQDNYKGWKCVEERKYGGKENA